MAMFTGLKDKLLNVKRNVSLFGGEDNAPKESPKFNVQAGAPILQHFQDQWEAMHDLNEANARAAQQVALEIEEASKRIALNRSNLELIGHLVTQTNLTDNISQCLRQVKSLYETCESIEKQMLELESVLEDVELDKMVKQHRHHLDSYRGRKQDNFDKLKHSQEEEYEKKLQEYEVTKKGVLEERQRVFQDAFRNDLEVYKSLGTLPKLDLPRQNGAILEEIQLEYDQNELEQFFKDDKA